MAEKSTHLSTDTNAAIAKRSPADWHSPIREQLRALREQIGQGHSPKELFRILECLEQIVAAMEFERSHVLRVLKRLEDNQRSMNVHIVGIENSRIFSLLRWAGRPLIEWRAKIRRMLPSGHNDQYELWLEEKDSKRPSLDSYRRWAEEFHWKPLFSLVLLVEKPRRDWLEQAIRAVLDQSYGQWEMCVHDDPSNAGWAREYFLALADADSRVRFLPSAAHVRTPEALNRACSAARGDYILFLKANDVLSPVALHHVAEALQTSMPDVIYTDEDRIDDVGRPMEPVFKPDWSPDLLQSCMYMGQLLAVSRKAFDAVGGFRSESEGAEYYDLVLRLTAGGSLPHHIPLILYRSRSDSQPSHRAGRRALEEHVRRYEPSATVEDGPKPNLNRVRRPISDEPLASLIVCSRSAKLLEQCLGAIAKNTDYPRREIIVVEHVIGDEAALEKTITKHAVKRVRYEGAFHFSRMNNLGARAAAGSILVFLNDDTEPLTCTWLTDLVAQVQRPTVGVVGAKLVYPSGTLQHAGVVIGMGDGCGHPGRGTYGSPYWRWLEVTRNVSAVTGACLAIRSEVFQELGGFDEQFPINYNDIDLCLRARNAGYWILYESAAILRHYECQSRAGGVNFDERDVWHSRWPRQPDEGDPFYNRNLTYLREDASLRFED